MKIFMLLLVAVAARGATVTFDTSLGANIFPLGTIGSSQTKLYASNEVVPAGTNRFVSWDFWGNFSQGMMLTLGVCNQNLTGTACSGSALFTAAILGTGVNTRYSTMVNIGVTPDQKLFVFIVAASVSGSGTIDVNLGVTAATGLVAFRQDGNPNQTFALDFLDGNPWRRVAVFDSQGEGGGGGGGGETSTPEPSTWVAVGLGLAVIKIIRRNRAD